MLNQRLAQTTEFYVHTFVGSVFRISCIILLQTELNTFIIGHLNKDKLMLGKIRSDKNNLSNYVAPTVFGHGGTLVECLI